MDEVKRQVHKVTIMVVDHDDLGPESLTHEMQEVRYPNRCVSPHVVDIETKEVSWSDEHPLNYAESQEAAFRALFEGQGDPEPMEKEEPGIRVGTVVRLRSGGPLMTVTDKVGDRTWSCSWFLGDGLERRAELREEALITDGMSRVMVEILKLAAPEALSHGLKVLDHSDPETARDVREILGEMPDQDPEPLNDSDPVRKVQLDDQADAAARNILRDMFRYKPFGASLLNMQKPMLDGLVARWAQLIRSAFQ